jgi:hypothetical protein
MMDRPEFVRESKSLAFPYSVYQALLEEPIDFDSITEAQAYSYGFGVRLDLTNRPELQSWSLPIPEDYYFHLETIRAFWPVERAPVTLFVNVSDPVHGRNITQQPIPFYLLTTPSNGRLAVYRVHFNTLFGARQIVSIQVTGQTGTDPEYVDLLADGLFIPRAKVDL